MLIAALRGVILPTAAVGAEILPVVLYVLLFVLFERVRPVYLLFHIFERTLVFFVFGFEVDGKFELFLALVQPVLLIKDYRLIIVPLPSAVIHIVQQRLRLREILRGNGGLDLVVRRALSAIAADFGVLVGVAHRVLIGGVEHFQHTRRVCARFALVEDVLLIIRALGLVRFEYLALGRALLNAENHKRVTWHLSSPLSKRSICIYSPR